MSSKMESINLHITNKLTSNLNLISQYSEFKEKEMYYIWENILLCMVS